MKKSNLYFGLALTAACLSANAPGRAAALQTASVIVVNNTGDLQNVSLMPSNWLEPLTFTLGPIGSAGYDMGLQLPLRFNATFIDQSSGAVHQCSAQIHQSKPMPSLNVVNSASDCEILVK